MDAARYEILRGLFGRALDFPAGERSDFVARNTDDEEIRRRALELLGAHAANADDAAFLTPVAREPVPAHGFIGPSVGPYRIIREIGRGGMGTVYLAERSDPAFAQRVAIKVLNRGLDTDDLLRRFEAERRMLARLQHPGIVRLLDGGATDDGRPYFAMEYVDGKPLVEYARSEGLSIDARIAIMADICDAVEYAHHNLVLHRDLKPANILVDATGRPRLLDFGIAQALDRDPTEGATRTSERRLTPQYASPEQILGRPLQTASDVYALGVILCELLTGSRPFEPHASEGGVPQIDAEPRAPSTLAATTQDGKRLRGDIDTIVLKALQKEPERRYRGAGEFADDLRRHLSGHPVAARADTLLYRIAKFTRRNRLAAAAVVAGLLATSVGVATTVYQARIAKVERERAERRFDETRKLANALVFEIHDAVQNLPGATKARGLIVQRSLEFFDQLRSDPVSDAALIREVATAYVRLGDVQGLPRFANLGDRAGAVASYQKALALRESIAEGLAGDPAFRLEGVQIEQRLGEVEDATGHLAAASARFRRSVEDGRALLSLPGAPESALRDVATSEALLGDTLGSPSRSNLGDLNGALSHHQAAVDLVDRWLALDPGNGERRHFSASFHARLGRTLGAIGRRDDALREIGRSIEMLVALQGDYPDVTPIRRDLASHRRMMADAWLDASRPLEALPLLDAARTTAKALIQGDPASVMEPQLAGNIELTRAVAFLRLGRASDALSSAESALGHARTVRARVPTDRASGSLLARAEITAAQAEMTLGRQPAASRRARTAIALAEELLVEAPDNASARIAQGAGLALLSSQEPPAAAQATRDRALSLLKQVEREGRLDREGREILAVLAASHR